MLNPNASRPVLRLGTARPPVQMPAPPAPAPAAEQAPAAPGRRPRRDLTAEMRQLLGVEELPPALRKIWSEDSPAPLALGVHRQLEALLPPGAAPWQLRRVLAAYCRRWAYLRALARPGAVRLGLDGAAEPVSAEHAAAARARLALPASR